MKKKTKSKSVIGEVPRVTSMPCTSKSANSRPPKDFGERFWRRSACIDPCAKTLVTDVAVVDVVNRDMTNVIFLPNYDKNLARIKEIQL